MNYLKYVYYINVVPHLMHDLINAIKYVFQSMFVIKHQSSLLIQKALHTAFVPWELIMPRNALDLAP